MTTVVELGDRIARLTLADAAQVRTYLKDRYGIEAAVGLGTLPNRKTIDPPLPPPEADAFDVVIDGVDAGNKITVIKTVRELTGAGLAEAKTLVETAPMIVRRGVDKADAETLRAKLAAAGAKVTLKAV